MSGADHNVGSWRQAAFQGLIYFYLTTLIVALAVEFGAEFLAPPARGAQPQDFIARCANWDGVWYVRIADEGYSYDPAKPSSVAFFPVFPLAARAIVALTGCRTDLALLLVANACCAGAFVMIARLAQVLHPSGPPRQVGMALLALGLFPTSFFFRMAYTEAPFLLCCLLVLYGMDRRWPTWISALICGLSTGTRSVGVALVPVLWLYLWELDREKHLPMSANSTGQRLDLRSLIPGWTALLKMGVYTPIACWGLLVYIAWQWKTFNEPFAFALTQSNWANRHAPSIGAKVAALITFEPLWSVFVPSSPAYWARHERVANPLFNITLLNPIFFVAVTAAVIFAWKKRWTTTRQALLGVLLMGIPYFLHSYEHSAAGLARFSALTWGVILPFSGDRPMRPGPLGALLCAFAACLMCALAAQFAAQYPVF